jgi:hypothetical protein
MNPAASFVLGIDFTKSYFCDSRCPFGQIDIQKHMLGRFISYFRKMYRVLDFKRTSRPFDYCKLDLRGHRWTKVMVIYFYLKILSLMRF